MSIVGGSLGELASIPASECTRPGITVCSLKQDLTKMKNFLIAGGITNPPAEPAGLVEEVKKILGAEHEADIYENKSFQNYIGYSRAKQVLQTEFKPPGPHDNTALLDNFNIDETLARWAAIAPDEFDKKFYHIPFQMIDFERTGSELQQTDLVDLLKKGYSCFGVVINTDVSSGRGIHWFCLYGDLKADPIQLEHFNSSGYDTKPEVYAWLQQQSINLNRAGYKTEIINATGGKQIQYSRTECGVWSLVYIFSRLKNHPYHWMVAVGANDEDMIQYRSRLFRN